MNTIVITQFDIEGFHHYPSAPQEVHFLSYKHRHTFTIKCGYKVNHDNRDKEIFICRDMVIEYLQECYGAPCTFNSMSCEMIAKEILEFGSVDGMVWCEVWEENTGGARVEL